MGATEMNPILENIRKANSNQRVDGSKSTGYSYVNWEQVKTVFSIRLGSIETMNSLITITESRLDALVN